MKCTYFMLFCWLCHPARAATIAFSGIIEYEAPQDRLIPVTIDYITFFVSEPTQISFEFNWPCCEPYPAQYTAQLVAMVGLTLLGDIPISIFTSGYSTQVQPNDRSLGAGYYALVISEEDAWNPRGYYSPLGYGLGAAGYAPYDCVISGINLIGLSAYEGTLDGGFTNTIIPEPGALTCASLVVLGLARRRRQ
jgi:hypothetical protein